MGNAKTWSKEDFEDKSHRPLESFHKKPDKDYGEHFQKLFRLMEQTDKSLLITGKAGTGKSTLLRYFLEHTNKSVVALAPTGLAAIAIGGQTIHKFFSFPPALLDESKVKKRGNSKIYKAINTIVIDEVSMVRADVFDAMDLFMRMHGKHKNKPFGGVQLILFGDLFQLPPVVRDDEKALFQRWYKSPYFFDAKCFKNCGLQTIELTEVFRQKEENFIEVLDKIRYGNVSQQDLSLINERVGAFRYDKEDCPIILTSTNKSAEYINQKRLKELGGSSFEYHAEIQGLIKKEYVPVEEKLILKEKARVIFVKNDPEGMFVNGSLGIVAELGPRSIMVKLDDGTNINLDVATWENKKYEYDEDLKEIASTTIGKLTQYPVKLAWALTIHKSQGQTFEKVMLDFSSGIWDHGQAYVALSRCTSLQGMVLKTRVLPSHIIVDQKVIDFLK